MASLGRELSKKMLGVAAILLVDKMAGGRDFTGFGYDIFFGDGIHGRLARSNLPALRISSRCLRIFSCNTGSTGLEAWMRWISSSTSLEIGLERFFSCAIT